MIHPDILRNSLRTEIQAPPTGWEKTWKRPWIMPTISCIDEHLELDDIQMQLRKMSTNMSCLWLRSHRTGTGYLWTIQYRSSFQHWCDNRTKKIARCETDKRWFIPTTVIISELSFENYVTYGTSLALYLVLNKTLYQLAIDEQKNYFTAYAKSN